MEKLSISITKEKYSRLHNNKKFLSQNINKNENNITYKKESLAAAYQKCFAKAVEEYNAGQKRADRKINGVKGYMDQVKSSGNGEQLCYEIIIQVGNVKNCNTGTEGGKVAKKILDEYMQNFKKRNPNLYIFSAVLHADEQTPYLHIAYIPLANDYKNGLKIRNSLDRALKQQGVEGKANKFENRTIAWQEIEKKAIEKIMNNLGIERAEDKGFKEKRKSIEYYKAVINDINSKFRELEVEISSRPTLLDKEKLTVKKEDLEILKDRAKLSLVHEEAAKKLINELTKSVKKTSEEFSAAKEYSIKYREKYKEALEIKEKCFEIFNQQKDLNKNYELLYSKYEKQKEIADKLREENTYLKAQILNSRL